MIFDLITLRDIYNRYIAFDKNSESPCMVPNGVYVSVYLIDEGTYAGFTNENSYYFGMLKVNIPFGDYYAVKITCRSNTDLTVQFTIDSATQKTFKIPKSDIMKTHVLTFDGIRWETTTGLRFVADIKEYGVYMIIEKVEFLQLRS